ncbi:hypothetical protein [Hephaestia mangrovi]|uniref:hypothetical protein n=1 Tax=Hephaestia mangrovi TaxID=2873268 RepID=UPI001CA69F6B|nr:hypothetical protein [Hephaestia mangrovi]MBY8828272.1 hypothetical protein [Hephaestia mangrovi]
MATTIAVLLAAQAGANKSEQDAVAKRFVAAVQDKRDYEDSDFVTPLREKDKQFFASFAKCRYRYTSHLVNDTPQKPGAYVEVPDEIIIGWKCKGVPAETPVGLTLVFSGTKIEKIETHNVDLMKAD